MCVWEFSRESAITKRARARPRTSIVRPNRRSRGQRATPKWRPLRFPNFNFYSFFLVHSGDNTRFSFNAPVV